MRAGVVLGAMLAALLGGCTKSTPLVCSGRVQVAHRSETSHLISDVAVRLDRWPVYVKLWNNSFGDFTMSSPNSEYFSYLELSGDNLFLRSNLSGDDMGIFNTLTGSLSLSIRNDVYDLKCRPATSIVK